MTTVVNMKERRFDIYIGRGSKWGNPFKITKKKSRDMVCDMYVDYFFDIGLIHSIHELKDKVLGCHCKPERCHGDFLADIVNNNIRTKEDYIKFLHKEIKE